ncbi:MAG: GNAT family N-acetyltransferase [Solobacterium sp.]|nr:GNAT family N-acetyltransferase [Solobacterium sp.]
MKKLFDEIPYLENDTVILKELTVQDLPELKKMIADPEVYRYLPTFLFEAQYEDLEEMLRELYGKCFREKESLILGIYTREEHCFCGLAEFYSFKDTIHKTCIGYRLRREFWGRGIATKTVSLMLEYLYTQTDTEIVTASTMIENKASARVLEKNGFIKTASSVPEDWSYDQPVLADKWFR